MIFYGRPGTGKTSAVRIIEACLDADPLELNGPVEAKIGDIRSKVERFASCVSLTGGPKICFIDEAEFLSKPAQASLRYVIENTSDHCRYLFTANDISKLDEALRSRLHCLCFDILPSQRVAVMNRLLPVYAAKLSTLGIKFDQRRLQELVAIYFPDFRTIANRLEFEFGAPSFGDANPESQAAVSA